VDQWPVPDDNRVITQTDGRRAPDRAAYRAGRHAGPGGQSIKIHRQNRTLGDALLDLRPIPVRLLDALLVALADRLFQHGHHPQRDQPDREEQSNDAEHDLVD